MIETLHPRPLSRRERWHSLNGGWRFAFDDALRWDVELIKQQKLEDPRWLYGCDRLGLLIWDEIPSSYRFSATAVDRTLQEWPEAVRRHDSHPCNESWGVAGGPGNAAHHDYVRTLYPLTKTLDPARPVVGNDGWEKLATDTRSIHDYTPDLQKLIERYGNLDSARQVLVSDRPGGRSLVLGSFQPESHALMLSEFGGVAVASQAEAGWGYSQVLGREEFLECYQVFMAAVRHCESLAGFCYTQFSDTFQEQSGLLDADHSPKVDLLAQAQATAG